jgi:hypothetical protein
MNRAKRLLNYSERQTYDRLKAVCDRCGASVYAKVRLADVLPIEQSGISTREYSFALKSHLDFVVTDGEHVPLFAVEFDGPSHRARRQQERDRVKDTLLERFSLPLLRVNSRYLPARYRNMDLLSWFVDVWFAEKDFRRQQESGEISRDEIFDPRHFVTVPSFDRKFPLWLSRRVRGRLFDFCVEGRCCDWVPSTWVGVDQDGRHFGIAWIELSEGHGVYVTSAIRSQLFPFGSREALEEILVFDLFDEIVAALDGRTPERSLDEIYEKVESYELKFKLVFAFGALHRRTNRSNAA